MGDPAWHSGRTENVSRSGILIRAEDSLPVQAEVEFRLTLALDTLDGEPPEIFCRGRVVRTVEPSNDEPRCGSAVAIEQYDFQPERGEQGLDAPAANND